MNGRIAQLSDYPFQRLSRLKEGIVPPPNQSPVDLSLGEPKHATPAFIREALIAALPALQTYPVTKGLSEFRQSVAQWIVRRYGLPAEAVRADQHILPCNGSREALFSIALAAVHSDAGERSPVVVIPNPFYQIYEGASLLAGAVPHFVNATEENGFLPRYEDLPAEIFRRTQLLYVCSPGNPTGAVAGLRYYQKLIELADRHDFIIASDECYSEIYDSEPPPGLLQAAWEMGNREFRRCVVFQSLSKRSNMPGARSGFVAGDADILRDYLKVRIYMGGSVPYFIQSAAAAAWSDESHVVENRRLYREKMDRFSEILSPAVKLQRPAGGFYIWLKTGDGERFTRELFRSEHVTVLPGAYLSREVEGTNPGKAYVRIALVAPVEECIEAAERIRRFLESYQRSAQL
ncbi:MAG: succinyldiaminopimelate transaminase [Nitrospirae bacterium]|nr:succinyldiaminopimelate transaminase [Nitrospirota bacterium]